MKDSSTVGFWLFIIFTSISFIFGMAVGRNQISSQVYQKCVTENKSKNYEEAVKLCKERIE
jgi:hypothetical protein